MPTKILKMIVRVIAEKVIGKLLKPKKKKEDVGG